LKGGKEREVKVDLQKRKWYRGEQGKQYKAYVWGDRARYRTIKQEWRGSPASRRKKARFGKEEEKKNCVRKIKKRLFPFAEEKDQNGSRWREGPNRQKKRRGEDNSQGRKEKKKINHERNEKDPNLLRKRASGWPPPIRPPPGERDL